MTITHRELVNAGRKWLKSPWRNATHEGHGRCACVLSEFVAATTTGEVPDVIGWHCCHSILIECKTSRADFAADAKKPFRRNPASGIGSQRWYLTPAGMLSPDELPKNWGLLELSEGTVNVVRVSGHFESNRLCEIGLLLSVIRRTKAESILAALDAREGEGELGGSIVA